MSKLLQALRLSAVYPWLGLAPAMAIQAMLAGLLAGLAVLQAQPATGRSADALAPVPPENLFQQPPVLQAQLSPSGSQLAVTSSRSGNRVGLLVFDLRPDRKTAQATPGALFTDADIVDFDCVGEARLVFSVLDLHSGGGEARRAWPGLFGVDPDGKNLRPLIKREDTALVSDGWSRERALKWHHQPPRPPCLALFE